MNRLVEIKRNMMPRFLFPLIGSVCLAAVACGSDDAADTVGGDAGAAGDTGMAGSAGSSSGGAGGAAGECAEEGTGTLTIEVTGLPDGVEPELTVEGPDAPSSAAAGSFEDIGAGEYTVTAARVTDDDPIVRTVYEPSVASASGCVTDGGDVTVTIEYAAIPSSNKLWMASGEDVELAGFSSADLADSAELPATVGIDGPGGKDVAFDKDGNLWALGPTLADPMIVRFDAADLGESGELEPSVGINLPEIECLPALRGMAFDSAGNLWLSACGGQVVQVGSADLGASGDDVESSVVVSGLTDNQGLAFDDDGNLWVADDGLIVRYDAERLEASDGDPPDLVLTVNDAPDAQQLAADRLAFDLAGNLWATDFGSNYVFMVGAAELDGSGESAVAADVSIAIGVLALLEGLAFDEGNSLWLTLDSGRFGKLTPEQLGVSTTPGDPTTPAVIIESTSVGSTSGLAFFPAPAGLPLYHSVP